MSEEQALTVSDAMRLAKAALERVSVRVIGEVSEVADRPSYKAVYFTLSDEASVMPCLIWRSTYGSCGTVLSEGMLAEVTGSFSAYAPKGRLQFVARSVSAAGEGVLRMQVAQLARKLEAEGLTRVERKRALPRFPRRIGVVTSPSGKAVHDVIRTLRRRYPTGEVAIAGVVVEGGQAVSAIVEGLRLVDAEPGVDVIILCRGGGSYEDLMPFNAEEVARAIVACKRPVVTGIGHEPDTTIADMVADFRASTPTAAAEAVAPAAAEVAQKLDTASRLLGRALSHRAREAAHRLSLVRQRRPFADPVSVFERWAQGLDLAQDALSRALPARLERDAYRVANAGDGLRRTGERVLERAQERVDLLFARLGDLSPLGILNRGYAVCYDETRAVIVRSVRDVGLGDSVAVRLSDGSLGCTVDKTEEVS